MLAAAVMRAGAAAFPADELLATAAAFPAVAVLSTSSGSALTGAAAAGSLFATGSPSLEYPSGRSHCVRFVDTWT